MCRTGLGSTGLYSIGNLNFSVFLAFDWLRNQIHCWTITNNNDLFIYYKHVFDHIIRWNSLYTVMNAMSINTALFYGCSGSSM